MKIETDELICGIRPAVLKKVLKHDRFDTLRLMQVVGLGEPDASTALRCLAEQGWISFSENVEGVDWWETAQLAERLQATRLIKRFPISVGRKIVEDVVAEARRLNQEPQRSRRIQAIYLFGSVLTGDEQGLAGDIDLVVEVARRHLPKADLEALEQA